MVAAGAAVTCDNPTGPVRHVVALAIQPELNIALSSFGGLSVNQVRLIAVEPPSDTVARHTIPFGADLSEVSASISVAVTDTATVYLTIQLLSDTTLLFSGVDTVLVRSGLTNSSPTPFVMDSTDYVGPGRQLASIQIAPRDSGVTFGGTLQFRVTGIDSNEAADSQFYTAWSTPGASNRINADGLFRAGATRGTAWVYAHTPTGIRDSTQVTVSPVPNQIQIVSGNNQTGAIGTQLAQPLVVKVLAADGFPVGNVTVQFTASSGTVNPASTMTDSTGQAQTTLTLGNTAGSVQVTAKVGTAAATSFAETATGQVGPAANVTKVAGDGQTATAGTAVAVAPTVKVTDASSNPVSGVAVTFAVATGGGIITGATPTTNASGLASVGSWTLGASAGANTLTATVSGLTPVTFTATGTSATGGVIVLSVPGNLVGIGAQQQVQAVVTISTPAPAGGLTVTVTSDSTQFVTVASPGTITIAAGQVTGDIGLSGVAAGATILHATAPGYTAGTTAAVATPNFINLTYDSVAVGRTNSFAGFKLSTAAPAGGLIVGIVSVDSTKLRFIKGAVTNPPVGIIVDTVPAGTGTSYIDFTITGLAAGTVPVYAAASNYAIGLIVTIVYGSGGTLALVSGGGQTGGVDTLLSQPITVQVDSAGVGISGYLVDFAVATGGGSVSTTGVLTNAAGQASTNWTLGPTPGTQSLSVTAPGATPLTVTATATGAAIASTTVTPKLDTITAINGTATLVAQAKTAAG
ncbi:MAG TPA: Ig-like domain-containing protein, partial [Gemmatimonadales bacterium]|nr:Ig-like domain-containing protein [Gemmatimonadales bacterium]